ncbi:hypothetical protein [Sulfuracidifex metallicus]|uniref:Uncharacterized protein n=1 Tax=Sulfuracidifex metallicus DSM 6482 = JCM 9184 TaxID=523847 RepID=A0A6A9QTF2_SULME|nr:hypothetical protein [Sulfuracidifex metallicus]MUN29043.1 hypothetical protein [Sulfuracidifex metallicus DSM 6482 = JCM 9184]WOE50447.1 hypothetical protein RQ359_001975 [Sulfuracidifex metallicus DSM 6482 = JCM 9184]
MRINKRVLGSIFLFIIVIISLFILYSMLIHGGKESSIGESPSGSTVSGNYTYLASFLISHDFVSYVSYNHENLSQLLSTPRIGIETTMAMEQAPLLADTHVYAIIF